MPTRIAAFTRVFLALSTLAFMLLSPLSCAQFSWSDASQAGSGTSTAKTVYLFSTLIQTTGAIGGRAGADTLCQTARNANTFSDNRCSSVRAFISLSAVDEIVDMPTNYGLPTANAIYSANGTLLATSFADMVDGTIAVSLATAGIPLINGWHSFSGTGTANGTLDNAANCTAGTDGSAGVFGRYGADNGAGVIWMSMTQAACSSMRHLLCACF